MKRLSILVALQFLTEREEHVMIIFIILAALIGLILLVVVLLALFDMGGQALARAAEWFIRRF